MSGSGDLEVLKLIRRLHVRIGHPEVTYGSHMAVHMALGLLFLGGGRYGVIMYCELALCDQSEVHIEG